MRLEVQRDSSVLLLESFVNKPYEGNEQAWQEFMVQKIGLELCYVNGVKRAIDDGRWRGKSDPITFIKKVGQTAALNFYVPQDLKDRGLADVGRVSQGALDPEQRHGAKNPRDYALRFDVPQRQGRGNAGPISFLRGSPKRRYAKGFSKLSYQGKLDRLIYAAGDRGWGDDYDGEPWIATKVAPELISNPDYKKTGDDPAINWDMVATRANLDGAERDVLVNYWSQGISRDKAIAMQPDEVKSRSLQAAWKRMDRKNTRVNIKNILQVHPSAARNTPDRIKEGALRSPAGDRLRDAIKRHQLETGVDSTGPSRFDSSGLPI